MKGTYDHQNRRYKKTVGSTVTHYVWQGARAIAEHNGSTGAVLTDYVYSGSRMIAKVSSGSVQYFLSDRLSTRLVTDTSENVSGHQDTLPFGEDFGESATQEKHHFTSYERDGEVGTDFAVNRQYSQNTGRFNRSDPLASSGKRESPQSWNRYEHSANDPINLKDPWGLFLGPLGWPEEDPCDPLGPTVIVDGIESLGDLFCIEGSSPSEVSPDPIDPAPSCGFELRTDRDSVPLGRGLYSRNQRLPVGFDPYVDNIGPGLKGGAWYYFFEVIFSNSASSIDDHLGWSITYQGGFSGTYRYLRPDGTLSDPVSLEFAEHPDPPIFGNAGFLTDLRYIWLDTPNYGTKHPTGADIVEANIQFSFTFEGKFEGNTICRKHVTFTLRVSDKVALPWGILEF